jgi:DNA-binding IclR family transcriptional regulator
VGGSEPAYGRVLDLLLAFSDRPTWSVDELADRLGDTKSTTYRLMKSLRDRDLIVRQASGGYALGPVILTLASNAMTEGSLPEVALPVMRQLAVDSGESVILTVVVGDKALALEQVSGPRPISLSFKPGTLRPLHSGASSKILWAILAEPAFSEALRAVLEPGYSDRPPADEGTLRSELDQIREQGFALTTGEYEPGVKANASPILDRRRRLHGAISIAGPEQRMLTGQDAHLQELLRIAVKQISTQLAPGRHD